MSDSGSGSGDKHLNTLYWSIGSEPGCDLYLEHISVSGHHANLNLAADGSINLSDCESQNGTFLNRSDCWVRVRKVTLCIGDRIRFGDTEVVLQDLTELLGTGVNARLGDRQFKAPESNRSAGAFTTISKTGVVLKKPVRNPLTGKLEERKS